MKKHTVEGISLDGNQQSSHNCLASSGRVLAANQLWLKWCFILPSALDVPCWSILRLLCIVVYAMISKSGSWEVADRFAGERTHVGSTIAWHCGVSLPIIIIVLCLAWLLFYLWLRAAWLNTLLVWLV